MYVVHIWIYLKNLKILWNKYLVRLSKKTEAASHLGKFFFPKASCFVH